MSKIIMVVLLLVMVSDASRLKYKNKIGFAEIRVNEENFEPLTDVRDEEGDEIGLKVVVEE